jgi:high affinity Mn2+ porin
MAGKAWDRPDDTVAIGFARNDISRHFKDYLNAGGLGILIGDGKLPDSGPEQVLETFYSFAIHKGVNLTADYQLIVNPAYNRDRGPADFLGLRLHAQF